MTDQSPAQKALADFNNWKKACIKGGRNRWKGSTKKQRSEAMRRVAMAKANNTGYTDAESGNRKTP